jgi:cystathionine beta-lyase family protein involved in aluminum resistance
MKSLSKSSQIKSVFRWLSGDKIPAYIASYHKINIWVREAKDGKSVLTITNSSYDTAETVVLMLKTECTSIKMYDMDCKMSLIHSDGQDGLYRKFTIPTVPSWQMRLISAE